MLVGRRRNRSPLRHLLIAVLCLAMCSSFIPVSGAMAQVESATPIAPTGAETPPDATIGTQSLAFARFEQSSTTAAAGGTVDLTLVITSTVTESTTGTFTIPAPASLAFSISGTNRTENMTACTADPDGSGGIAGTYSIATGSGVCSIAFTAQIDAGASGTRIIASTIRENDIEAGSTSTTIDILSTSITGTFNQSRYVVAEGQTSPTTFTLTMSGTITNGTFTIQIIVPPNLPGVSLASPSAATQGNSGTCAPGMNGGEITGTFSNIDSGEFFTCVISFDIISAPGSLSGMDRLAATADSTEVHPEFEPVFLSNLAGGAPEVTFNPASMEMLAGTSMRAVVTITYPYTGNSIVMSIASPAVSVTDPEIVDENYFVGGLLQGVDGACAVEDVGGIVTLTIAPQVFSPGICKINVTLTVQPMAVPGDYTITATSMNPVVEKSVPITIIEATSGSISASFDQPEYAGTPVDYSGIFVIETFNATLNITVPAGTEIPNGTFAIAPSGDNSVLVGATVTGSGGTCAVDQDDEFPALAFGGTFSTDGLTDFSCSVSVEIMIMSISQRLVATVSDGSDPVLPHPSTLLSAAELQVMPLYLDLSPSVASPGDEVEVSIAQPEVLGFLFGKNRISTTLPPGVALVEGSVTMSCGNCSIEPVVTISGRNISGETFLPISLGQISTAVLTFRVVVTAPAGSNIDFYARGTTTMDDLNTLGPITLTVQGAAPTASDFTLVVEAGGSVSGTLADHLASENGVASYSNVAPGGDGAFTLDLATGAFTYTASDSPGTDSVAYTVTDTANLEASGTIAVTIIDPMHLQSVAHDMLAGDTFTLDLNQAVTGGQIPHTFTPVTAQALPQGTLTITADGVLTYVANADATGTETITFTVTDGLGLPPDSVTSAAVGTGTVSITFRDPLVFVEQPLILQLLPGESRSYDLHDAISGGTPPFTFVLLSPPLQGTASIDAAGILTFTANDDATGSESLHYDVEFIHDNVIVTAAEVTTGTITVTYLQGQAPTATATSPDGPTATATTPDAPTATDPAGTGPTVTATAPDGPGPTSTDPAGTTPPGQPGDGDALPGQPGRGVSATVTPVAAGSSGVRQLPATGAGETGTPPVVVWGMMLLALLLIGCAVRRRSQP